MPENPKSKELIRVAHIITGLQTGGAEAMLNKLTQGEKGQVDAIVISLTEGGRYRDAIEKNGIPVHVLDFRKIWKLPLLLWRLRNVIRQHNAHITQAWMYHAIFFSSLAYLFSRHRPRMLWNIRHSLNDIKKESRTVQLLIKLLSYLVFLPDRVIFNSMNSAKEHQRYWSISSKVAFLPNGFEMNRWQPARKDIPNKLRHLISVPEGFIFGNVARLHPMKNQAGLIKVFERLRTDYPDIHLVLIGTGTDTLLTHTLPDNIHLLGERADIPDLLPGLDCFVLSSNWGEGFPNVLGEAMACELPCLTTDVGDSAMLLSHDAWVVPPFDEEALLQKLQNMLSLSEAERAQLGKRHQQRVSDEFEMSQVTRQYVQLYGRVMD